LLGKNSRLSLYKEVFFFKYVIRVIHGLGVFFFFLNFRLFYSSLIIIFHFSKDMFIRAFKDLKNIFNTQTICLKKKISV
jgi:hypothetical protein